MHESGKGGRSGAAMVSRVALNAPELPVDDA